MGMQERVGVYLCHCGSNIASTVNIEELAKYSRTLPGVHIVRDYKYMCSDPGQELIIDDIKELGLTKVVVASCSPLMHEATFRKACADAGLNQFNFQMANVREHASWVTDDEAEATRKAKGLVGAAVRRVVWHEPLEITEVQVTPRAMVVGGGIAGIEAALRIADSGKEVILVERESTIGGHMALFDKTFPTLDCAACILTPKMVNVGQHPNIKLLTYSEVVEVGGFVGNFQVKVRKNPRYVDEDLCTGCGTCVEKCPWKKIPSEFDQGLGNRAAIYFSFPQAVPRIPVIDVDNCAYFQKGKCKACEKFCPTGAIKFDQQEEILEFDIGTIVLATGFKAFEAARITQYGYGVLPQVYTSLEVERLCNASGPTSGHITLRDGSEPESVALIHCVGSRDHNYNAYCSRVCCMYSLKLAHLVQEHSGARIYDFYIDMRAFGKGFEEFYERIQTEGVTFIHGKVSSVEPGENGKAVVRAEDTGIGRMIEIPVDMVILATGLEPQPDQREVGHMFGVSRSPDGFFLEKHPKLGPIDTANDGVYIAGACQGPKDIPDTVAQGGAAAAAAIALMDRGVVEIEPITAYVNQEQCGGCRVCVDVCPYQAISRIEVDGRMVAEINEALCKACGTCVAACPAGAITQRGFTNDEIFAEIDGALLALALA